MIVTYQREFFEKTLAPINIRFGVVKYNKISNPRDRMLQWFQKLLIIWLIVETTVNINVKLF